MNKLVFFLIFTTFFFIYLVFIFYDELFRENIFVINFDIKFLNKFNFMKKGILGGFPISIDVYPIVSSFFESLSIFNINFNIKINLFKRPGVILRLFFFNIIYNFIACYLICYITWIYSWFALTSYLRYSNRFPEWYMYINFKTAPFFMYILITFEFLIIIIILCFVWWKFEYTILIPLNLLIIFFLFFCFLFNFFCKFLVYLFIYLTGRVISCACVLLAYPFKNACINFFNGIKPWIKHVMWDKSSTFSKACICIYIFITFNLLFFSIYLYLYNFIFH